MEYSLQREKKKKNSKKRSIKGNCITELQWGMGLESITEDHISGIYLQGPCSLWAAIRYIQLIFHNWLNPFFFSYFLFFAYSTVHYGASIIPIKPYLKCNTFKYKRASI